MQPAMHPLHQIRNMNQPVGSRHARDLSGVDLSGYKMNTAGSGEGLLVNFFYAKVKTRNRDAEFNGKIQTRLCVSKQPRGDRSTVAVRYITEEQASREFPQQFAMFKDMGEVMTSGTPLDELPGISISQIGLLVVSGIRSVEDLAGVSDDVVAQIGREASVAQKTAKAWLKRKAGAEDVLNVAEMEASRDIEKRTLTEELEKSRAAVKALEQQVAAMLKAQQGQFAAQTAMPGSAGASGSVVQATEVSSDDPSSYIMSEDDNPLAEGPGMTSDDDDMGGGAYIDPLAD